MDRFVLKQGPAAIPIFAVATAATAGAQIHSARQQKKHQKKAQRQAEEQMAQQQKQFEAELAQQQQLADQQRVQAEEAKIAAIPTTQATVSDIRTSARSRARSSGGYTSTILSGGDQQESTVTKKTLLG